MDAMLSYWTGAMSRGKGTYEVTRHFGGVGVVGSVLQGCGVFLGR